MRGSSSGPGSRAATSGHGPRSGMPLELASNKASNIPRKSPLAPTHNSYVGTSIGNGRSSGEATARATLPRATQEMILVVGLFLLYEVGRFLARPEPDAALANGLAILRYELASGFYFEPVVQALALQSDALVHFLNNYYVLMHLGPTGLFLVWVYVRRPGHYTLVRRIFLLSTAVGLAIHWVVPLAPPRLVPETGMTDTLELFESPFAYSSAGISHFTNQFAAMPSFHFGWALFIAVAFVALTNHPWRYAALAHPALMLVAITATGNHFLLDAVGAAVLEGGVAWAVLRYWRDEPVFRGLRRPTEGPS